MRQPIPTTTRQQGLVDLLEGVALLVLVGLALVVIWVPSVRGSTMTQVLNLALVLTGLPSTVLAWRSGMLWRTPAELCDLARRGRLPRQAWWTLPALLLGVVAWWLSALA